jgi:2,4-dienoyl-CoA reductase-like NADH-dependent reductase (Old Yellow Enzyme family)
MNCADYLAEGQGVEAYAEIAGTLVAEGIDLIELSGGLKDQMRLRQELKQKAGPQEAYFREAIVPFQKAIGDKCLAVTGGIRSLEVMEELLAQGVHFIGLSRPLICEPNLPGRLLDTPDKRQSKCTSCNRCLPRIAKQSLKCVAFDDLQKIINNLS